MIDIVSGGFLTSLPVVKRPTDIQEQALMIKDIGHGMRDGPITMGRFGIGKYTPPDRSDEILSSIVARQMELNQAEEKKADTEAEKAAEAIVKAVAESEAVSVNVSSNKSHSEDLDLD
jgi:hypothetical protein